MESVGDGKHGTEAGFGPQIVTNEPEIRAAIARCLKNLRNGGRGPNQGERLVHLAKAARVNEGDRRDDGSE